MKDPSSVHPVVGRARILESPGRFARMIPEGMIDCPGRVLIAKPDIAGWEMPSRNPKSVGHFVSMHQE
jgi:hypothetical protein